MGMTARRIGASAALILGGTIVLSSCGSSEKAPRDSAPGGDGGVLEGGAGGNVSQGAGGSVSAEAGQGSGGDAGAPSGSEAGAGAEDGAGAGGEDSGGPPEKPIFTSGKVDLLLVVDNSISMGDKQALLAKSVPALVERLVDPWCVGVSGASPALEDGTCPNGTEREHAAVRDLHVGVLSSSLGAHGGQTCSDPEDDDHAHLIGTMRPDLSSWNESGYLKWDPEGASNPPGTSDASALAQDLRDMVLAAGDTGCGFEAPLESLYRFLVDPAPPLTVTAVEGLNVIAGVDQVVLDQRAAFLRPDSAVMAIIISDENDCSIRDDGQSHLVTTSTNASTPFRMPRSTAACAEDPNDACCRSCASADVVGCVPHASDVECQKGTFYLAAEDALNLRCFDQKRRFGFDFLHPIERYVRGFSAATVPNREGELVPNPLFAGGRDPSLMMLTVIAGVPWQDLVLDHENAETLEYLSTEELGEQGRWGVIVGDPDEFVAPTDPFMVESIAPRGGTNPLTGHATVSSSSVDPTATLNGHEYDVLESDDLQYACIFPLETPIDCQEGDSSCDCQPSVTASNKPICQAPTGSAAGSTQYYGKAYPGIRLLEVARRLDEQSVVASICPRNVVDETHDDFGYFPALRALQRRLGPKLE
jgi:hypothetical protein